MSSAKFNPIEKRSNFRVIIAGGSIAGLTLAKCLDTLGIDCIVLERHKEIAPQLGASVGVFPNGARILDQLGLFDTIEQETEPIHLVQNTYPDGFSFPSEFPKLLAKRHGYPLAFLERQKLIEILFNSLKGTRQQVIVGKEVSKVEHIPNGVRVITADGSFYDGDLVVGADGVRSIIRTELWRHADMLRPELISAQEKKSMFADYACVFGISCTPKFPRGTQVTGLNDGFSFLVVPGKAGKVFWFFFKKLEQRYHHPDIPRFSSTDAEKVCTSVAATKLTKSSTFGDLWSTRVTFAMTALEENTSSVWHYLRIVCIGDAVHKMTPNLGQGANCAIESAAALANALQIHIQQDKPGDLNLSLEQFSQSRVVRCRNIVGLAGQVTRLHAQDGFLAKVAGRYYAPYAGDLPANLLSEACVGAVKLAHLPVPARAKNVWMPFDRGLGIAHKPNIWARAAIASVILLPAIARLVDWPREYERIEVLGKHEIETLIKIVPTQALWTIEAGRKGNSMTVCSLSLLFLTLQQILGAGLMQPAYYFLHYISCPWQRYHALDRRTVRPAYAAALFPMLMATYGVLLMLWAMPSHTPAIPIVQLHQETWWYGYPGIFATAHWLLAVFLRRLERETPSSPASDLPALRCAYFVAGSVPALIHLYKLVKLVCNAPEGVAELLSSAFADVSPGVCSLVWALLHLADMKKDGRCSTSWIWILSLMIPGVLLMGPGAAVLALWAFREEMLAQPSGTDKS